MNTNPELPDTEKHPNTVAAILKLARALAIFPLVTALLLFAASGRLGWAWAWVYLGIHLANALIVGPIAIRTMPVPDPKGFGKPLGSGEDEEPEQTEQWDAGSVLYLIAMYIALPLVAGLDLRFGWAPDLGLAWHVAGAAVLTVGLGLPSWVMIVNPFVWSDVPVQHGQTVCSAGPYRIVRHPAYAGLILQALGVPLLLGSLWALVPSVAAAVCIIVATSAEDRVLHAELPGYQDYAQQVRFRLVPGIW